MTKAMKKTGTRLAQWFKTFREKNRPPMTGMSTACTTHSPTQFR
jgi:hypothetical protein